MMKFYLIVVPFAATCLSLPQSYRAPSRGGNSFGGGGDSYGGRRDNSRGYGSSSGGFSSAEGHGRSAQFGSFGGQGGSSGGYSGQVGAFEGFGGQGRSSGDYGGSGQVIPILVDNREGPLDGNYNFEYETGDGASRKEEGTPSGPYGAVVQQGGWSFTFPDGTQGQFSFVADENGYRVQSPLLPVAPPPPPHALAQIEKAERERAQGIVHDGRYSDRSDEQNFGGHGFQSGQRGESYGGQRRGFNGGQGFQGQPQRASQTYNF